MPGGFKIHVSKDNFEATGWHENLIEKDISEVFFRVKSLVGISNYYKLKQVAFDNGLNSYVLTSGKQFGGDMSHTSPNETWNNRLRNCELQIIKRIPENKSQFQGRFFVKILKDATLIDRLHMISESTEDLIPVGYQPKVQYINGTADDVSQFTGRYAWNGFGVDSSNPWSAISIDKKNMDFWAIPDAITDDHCDGARFWKMAANNTEANNESESSGWFIDKVEAFRPYYNMRWKKDISGASRDAAFNSWDQFGNIYEPYKDTSINHSRMLQVSPINTYVNTSQGGDYTNSKSYLNIWELKQELFTTPSII